MAACWRFNGGVRFKSLNEFPKLITLEEKRRIFYRRAVFIHVWVYVGFTCYYITGAIRHAAGEQCANSANRPEGTPDTL